MNRVCAGGCGRTIRPQRCSVQSGFRHGGRGLCARCYDVHDYAGTLADFARTTRSREQVLEAWELHRDKWEAARAVSMTMSAFERALQRARQQTPRPATAGRGQ